jgi:hypothetical protein
MQAAVAECGCRLTKTTRFEAVENTIETRAICPE